MAQLNRRQALTLGAAACAAAAVPNIPFAAPPPAAPAPVWLVGTPGEFNWQAVRAMTEDAAKAVWAQDRCGLDACETGKDGCDCDFCCEACDCEAERKPEMDALIEITAADWLNNGMGHICSRCGNEAFRDDGARAVNKEAICGDCMTLADWDIADPERAAEIRADMDEEAIA